jgi:thioredoxin-like negative regulator of GroEL
MEETMKHRNGRLQWILGGLVFLISLVTYLRTVAPTTSFWDCGEFIACSRILGVMHPPGAPLYLLIGRILTLIPFIKDIGLRVNLFSVFISAATVVLTYLVIVQLIRRWRGEARNWEERLILYGSSVLGALAFAFTDSFWFNAVEAEVYALSMFFTAAVVWIALYWGERSEQAGSILLIFLIFYLFGLAAGVHLLNVLAFPFVLLIAFFHNNRTVRRLLLLLFIQGMVPFLLYIIFYQFDPSKMQYAERILAHQAKAGSFLKWFGLIWVSATLVYVYMKDREVFTVWWVLPVLVLVAYSVYMVIYVRAGLAPPINENDPSTPKAMMDYLGRKQYGTESMFLTFWYRKADFWHYQIHRMYTRYFGWQFIGKGVLMDAHDRIIEMISLRGLYGLPFLVGLWGAVHHFTRDWKRAVAVLVLFLILGYAIIIYLNQPDPQPRERDYSYVGSFFAFALWIGIGMAGILEWISEGFKRRAPVRRVLAVAAGILLFIAVPFNLFATNFESHDRSGNYVAWDYSYNILQTCEPDGIIFTNGDNDTFPLWYLQEVEGIRKDVRVICLSLLNTSWYIRQLRDQEPKVPIQLNDGDIQLLGEYSLLAATAATLNQFVDAENRKLLNAEVARLKEKGDLPKDYDFRRYGFPYKWWEVAKLTIPTPDSAIVVQWRPVARYGNYLRVQDYMIYKILADCKWERPVYYAVTVSQENKIGLASHLRMDGLAWKVMPQPITDVNMQLSPDGLRQNLLEKYRYRNLGNPHVYYNTGIVKLLINARAAFLQLARYYITQGDKKEALFILDAMSERIPEENVPYTHEDVALRVAELYTMAGRPDEYKRLIRYILPGPQISRQEKLELVGKYLRIYQNWERAESILNELIQTDPNDMEAIYLLVQTYAWSRQYEKGIKLLEDLKLRIPNDPNIQKNLDQLRQMAKEDTLLEGTEDSLATSE